MAKYDLICPVCNKEYLDIDLPIGEDFPDCECLKGRLRKIWNRKNIPAIGWQGPGSSPKKYYNANEHEVEEEMFSSIVETEDKK